MGRLRVATMVLAIAVAIAVPAGAAERPAGRWVGGVRVMPGGAIVGDRIVYEGGDVIVVPEAGDSFDTCLSGYVCLFENTSWTGNSRTPNQWAGKPSRAWSAPYRTPTEAGCPWQHPARKQPMRPAARRKASPLTTASR